MHGRLLIDHSISWFHIVEQFLHPLFATYIVFAKSNVTCALTVAELEEQWNFASCIDNIDDKHL